MLRCHFLNVGAGDCIIVEHESGRVSVVDINNSSTIPEEQLIRMTEATTGINLLDTGAPFTMINEGFTRAMKLSIKEWLAKEGYDIELTNPIDYYKRHIGKKSIFRFIATHPHMDHLYGLARLKQEIDAGNLQRVDNVWDTEHDFKKDFSDPRAKGTAEDWNAYCDIRDGKWSTKRLSLYRNASRVYFDKENDWIEIWAPTPDLVASAKKSNNPNTLSYVIEVHHGVQSIVLAGDAENETWDSIHEWFVRSNIEKYNIAVLKAAHHGHDSGFHEGMMGILQPQYVVVSEGKKDPSVDASSRYKTRGADVLSTRWWGNILVELDGVGGVSVYTEQRKARGTAVASITKHYRYGEAYWLLPKLPTA